VREHRITPGLAVVLVGSDPASEIYVRSKHKQTQAAGMASFEHVLPADVAQDDLLALIAKLNRDPAVHGILVQLPLPKSVDTETIINAIDPAKDVDGLHPNNAGRLAGGFAALSPCTPLGCIILTKSVLASRIRARVSWRSYAPAPIWFTPRSANRKWCAATGSSRAPR